MPAFSPRNFSDAERFLALQQIALDYSSKARFALFCLPRRLTFASRSLSDITNQAVAWMDRGENVYIHTHLHELPEGSGAHRGGRETARVAIGIWLDIDAAAPGRKKPEAVLCPSATDALALVDEFNARFAPLQASLVICSGYGCYVAVLFREPHLITAAEDQELMESLGRRFQLAFHMLACKRGWSGASELCDLSKVLRLPGTLNFKDPTHPRPVTIHAEEAASFTLMDLDELLPPLGEKPYLPGAATGTESNGNGELVTGRLILDPNAMPPRENFALLCQMEPEFAWTWNHKRKLQDQSQSGYDLALAYRAVAAGWSDQEVANLMIANRRLHGGKPKLRLDYYERTIARAHTSADVAEPFELDYPRTDQAHPCLDQEQHGDRQADGAHQPPKESDMDHLEANWDHSDQDGGQQQPADPTTMAGGTDTSGAGAARNPPATDPQASAITAETHPTGACAPAVAAALLSILSKKLRFRILRLRRLNSEPAQFRLLTEQSGERKEVKLVDVTELINQTKFRNRIADAIGHYIPRLKVKEWDDVCAKLLKACEPEDLGDEATDRGQVDAWVTHYLTDQHIHASLQESLGNHGENDSSHQPFREDGAVWLRVEGLQEWLRIRRGEKAKLTALTAALRDSGFQRKKFNVVIDNKPTSRMAWKVPARS